MDTLRPEYLEAIDKARLLAFLPALAVPIVMLVWSAKTRSYRLFILPAAYFLTWLAMCFAVEYFWEAKWANAETDAEFADAAADTARVFAPVTLVPIVLIYVSIVAAIVFPGVAAVRWFLFNLNPPDE